MQFRREPELALSLASRASGALAAALVTLHAAPAARAQPPPAPPPAVQREADERFHEGKALIEQGLVAEGCEKLARSLALWRRGGTLLNLAVCREKEGRYATALALYQDALAIATADGNADREELARRAIEGVRAKLSWLQVKPAAGADVPDLTILRDGEAVPRSAWGSLGAVDPGAHTIAARAPGRVPYETTVTLTGPGDRKVVEVPPLAPVQAADTKGDAPAPPPVAPAASRPAWMRPAGVAALGLGVVGVGIGSVLGIKTILDAAEVRRLCPGDVCRTDEGLARHAEAQSAATGANIAIPAGLAVAGAGLFLLLWSPAPEPPSPTTGASGLWVAPAAGPAGAGALLGGAW